MTSIAILESWSCSLRELHSKFHLHLLWLSPRKETHTKVGIFPVLFFSFKDQNWNVTRKHKNLLYFFSSLQKRKEKISTLWLISLKNIITRLRQKIKGLGLWYLTSNCLKPDSKGKYTGAFNMCAFESIPSKCVCLWIHSLQYVCLWIHSLQCVLLWIHSLQWVQSPDLKIAWAI